MNQNNQQPGSADLDAIYAFLDGSAPLDGVWFGEEKEGVRGKFWWRKNLRDAIAASRRAPSLPDVAMPEQIEVAAKAIYELFPGDRTGDARTYPWQPGGNSFKQDDARRYARAALEALAAQPSEGSAQHPDDIAVDRFAAAMKEKMAKSRAKGRGGWDDPAQCNVKTLQAMLTDHLAKGDPVDVGNFAMMLFSRDGRTCAVPEGFALVPTMYTTAMRNAWDSEPLSDDDDSDFAGSYAAMVAAAPKPGEMPQYVTCGACDGTGYYASDSTDICEDCNGAGEVEATNKEWS